MQLTIPIMADESLFDHFDALCLVNENAVDYLQHQTRAKAEVSGKHAKFYHIAEAAGIKCQVGCFSESRLGLTALAHFAQAFQQVIYYDMDSALMLGQKTLLLVRVELPKQSKHISMGTQLNRAWEPTYDSKQCSTTSIIIK